MQNLSFDCDRTCPLYERIDLCRFQRALRLLGVSHVVNSHTVTVAVEFRDMGALELACANIGARWIGQGSHRVWNTSIEGVGFQLSGWSFPCVVGGGQLSYDNYGGAWGSDAEIEKLKAEYIFCAAERAAQSAGWQYDRCLEGLRIYHPNGGHLIVTADGTTDAIGFNGIGCHEAVQTIGGAIGTEISSVRKPEAGNIQIDNSVLP